MTMPRGWFREWGAKRTALLGLAVLGCTVAPDGASSEGATVAGGLSPTVVADACQTCDRSGRMAIGGTQSLFLGEGGAGQFDRSVEGTSGARIRAALAGDPLAEDFLEREAVELSDLPSATPPNALVSQIARFRGEKGAFLQAGARRLAYVLEQAREHPVGDPCSYTGPLIPTSQGNYDPQELCWWSETFRLVGVRS